MTPLPNATPGTAETKQSRLQQMCQNDYASLSWFILFIFYFIMYFFFFFFAGVGLCKIQRERERKGGSAVVLLT